MDSTSTPPIDTGSVISDTFDTLSSSLSLDVSSTSPSVTNQLLSWEVVLLTLIFSVLLLDLIRRVFSSK